MDWVTIIWSAIGSVCLTAGLLSTLVWFRDRQSWPHFWFALAAFSVTAIGVAELMILHAISPASAALVQQWAHVPVFLYILSLVWFTYTYLRSGAWWLAWLVVAARVLVLVINFAGPGSVNFSEITALAPFDLFGQVVHVPIGVQSPWSPIESLTVLLAVFFVAHATTSAWRRDRRDRRDRQRSLIIGIAVSLSMTVAATLGALLHAGMLLAPYFISPAFLLVIVAMGYLLSEDLLNSEQLSRDLREHQARLDLAAGAGRLGFWEWHAGTRGLWLTEQLRRLLCFDESEPASVDNWLTKVHPEDREFTESAFLDCMTRGGRFRIEYRVKVPDGGTRWIAAHGQAELNQLGNPVLVRGIALDVTDQHESALERDKLRWDLAHAGRVSMLGQLASSLAHELNQPLGAILRNAEAAAILLQADSPDLQELREITEDIRRDDSRAGKVISRLRSLLKDRVLQADRVDFSDLVDEVLTLLRTEAISRGVQLRTVLKHGNTSVRGDPIHLQQVLMNLVMNGLDAASRGTGDRFVFIRSRLSEDGMLEVSVEDSGTGVPSAEADRIFEPFYTTKKTGMGLGLSICRTIVEAHGGKIWLDGEAELRGAVFRFTLATVPEKDAA